MGMDVDDGFRWRTYDDGGGIAAIGDICGPGDKILGGANESLLDDVEIWYFIAVAGVPGVWGIGGTGELPPNESDDALLGSVPAPELCRKFHATSLNFFLLRCKYPFLNAMMTQMDTNAAPPMTPPNNGTKFLSMNDSDAG